MGAVGRLVISVVGDQTQFNKDMAGVTKTLNAQTKGILTMSKSMTSAGDAMTKGITAPLLAVGAVLLKIGTDFDSAYDKIRVNTGKTGKELTGLQTDFKEIAKVAPSSFDDISTAVAGFSQKLDLSGKPLQNLSTQILNLSRITKTDLSANIDESAKVFNNWKISTENQGKTLDLMFRASEQTGIGITDLMAKVADSGQVLRGMGYDIETSIALISGFDKAGVDATTAITGMKKALVTMAKEGMSDPQEVLAMYVEKIKGAKTNIEAVNIAAELFGTKGGTSMAMAIREGRLNLDDLIESLKNGKDSINAASDSTKSFQEQLILLKNNLGIALEPLASKVFDSAGRVIEGVTPKIESMATSFGNLSPKMQDNIILWSAVIAVIPIVVSGFGRVATGAIKLRAALLTMNAAITASSFGGYGATAFQALASGAAGLAAASPAILGFVEDINLLKTASGDMGKIVNNMKGFSFGKQFTDFFASWGSPEKQAADKAMIQMAGEIQTLAITLQTASPEIQAKALLINAAFNASDKSAKSVELLRDGLVELTKEIADSGEASAKHKYFMDLTTEAMKAQGATTAEITAALQGETAATDDATKATDTQRQATDDLRKSFNQLIDDMFGGITTYNDFEDSEIAVKEAQKALTEAIKEFGKGSDEATKAANVLDSANLKLIEDSFKLSTSTEATTAQQEEARKKAVELGLQYVSTGQISVQAFLDMAAKFGMSSEQILTYADKVGINVKQILKDASDKGVENFITMAYAFGMSSDQIIAYAETMGFNVQGVIDSIHGKEVDVKVSTGQGIAAVLGIQGYIDGIHGKSVDIGVSIGQGIGAVLGIQRAIDSIQGKSVNVVTNVYTLYKKEGGPVGFANGGIMDNVLAAAQRMSIPKFDKGGVLAVLHPPELVLNGKEALQLVWNMATDKSQGSKSGPSTINIYPQWSDENFNSPTLLRLIRQEIAGVLS